MINSLVQKAMSTRYLKNLYLKETNMAVLRTLRFFLNYACQYIREHLNVTFEVSHCQGIKR